MNKFIEFVFSGPPSEDALRFVKIIDEDGTEVRDIGEWYHDGEHWRYQVPTELVPRMVLTKAMKRRAAPQPVTSKPKDFAPARPGPGKSRRERLRERVGAATKKKDAMQDDNNKPTPADWITCPGCKKKFDPRKDELLSCPNCGGDRSTACCLPNPTRPCLDCDALAAVHSPDEDEDTTPASSNPVDTGDGPFASRLFDGNAPVGKEDDDDES